MYKNVLIPIVLDEGHQLSSTLQVAKSISDPGAKLTLLHVLEQIPEYASVHIGAEAIKMRNQDAKDRMKVLADGVEGASVAVIEGHSARSIIQWAEDNHNDCIVISSHKPGLQDYFLGGTAARVVRYSKCAVHVLR